MNALKIKTLALITLIMSLLASAIMVLGGGPLADKMLLGIIGSIILVVHIALIIGDLVQSLYQRVLAISLWVVVATIPTHALLKSLGATESWGSAVGLGAKTELTSQSSLVRVARENPRNKSNQYL